MPELLGISTYEDSTGAHSVTLGIEDESLSISKSFEFRDFASAKDYLSENYPSLLGSYSQSVKSLFPEGSPTGNERTFTSFDVEFGRLSLNPPSQQGTNPLTDINTKRNNIERGQTETPTKENSKQIPNAEKEDNNDKPHQELASNRFSTVKENFDNARKAEKAGNLELAQTYRTQALDAFHEIKNEDDANAVALLAGLTAAPFLGAGALVVGEAFGVTAVGRALSSVAKATGKFFAKKSVAGTFIGFGFAVGGKSDEEFDISPTLMPLAEAAIGRILGTILKPLANLFKGPSAYGRLGAELEGISAASPSVAKGIAQVERATLQGTEKVAPRTTKSTLPAQYNDKVLLDSNGRLIQLTGRIEKSHLGTGEKVSKLAQIEVQKSGKFDAGHVRANNLGGKGGLENTFPQFPPLNRGQFRLFEHRLARIVAGLSNSDSIIFSVRLTYNSTSKIPAEIIYRIRIDGITIRASFNNTTNVMSFIQY